MRLSFSDEGWQNLSFREIADSAAEYEFDGVDSITELTRRILPTASSRKRI